MKRRLLGARPPKTGSTAPGIPRPADPLEPELFPSDEPTPGCYPVNVTSGPGRSPSGRNPPSTGPGQKGGGLEMLLRNIRVFISSPGDVPAERQTALEVIGRLRTDPFLRD